MRRRVTSLAVSLLLALAVLRLACPPAEAAPNWPMWLENPAHMPTPGIQANGVVRTEWHVECGGIFGSAVVYEGGAYFASRDGHLYAVDDATGDLLWKVHLVAEGTELREPVAPARYLEVWQRREVGFLATPAADDDRVYVGGMDGVFYARERETGDPAWDCELTGAIASSPLLISDLVVVGTRGGDLIALGRATGEPKWVYEAGGPINSSPAFADGRVLVGTPSGVVAVDATTGSLVWETPFIDGGKFDCSPCISGEGVYIGDWTGKVVALNLSDGDVRWEQQVADRAIFATPAAAYDVLYVVATNADLFALDIENGAVLWETDLGARWARSAYASPVVCGPVVLVACGGDSINVVDAMTGDVVSKIWRGSVPYVHGTPTVTDQAIYLAGESQWSATWGSVAKLIFSPYAPRDEALRAREAASLICLELGWRDQEPAPEYDGWDQAQVVSAFEDAALRELMDRGLVTQRWNWRGPMSRYQLAAFFHKLFWEPNPLHVRLPAYEEAELADARALPPWVRETPAKVVGLGLMQPINGAFEGSRAATLTDLRVSLARTRELLEGP